MRSFRNTGYQSDNPFQADAYSTYIYLRYLRYNSRWRRTPTSQPNIFAALLDEMDFYNDSDVYELARVLAVQLVYTGHWYNNRQVLRSQVLEIIRSMGDRDLAEIGHRVIRKHNRYGIGDRFPNVKVLDQHGSLLSINEVDGDYLLVDIWATWCRECIREMRTFAGLQQKYGEKLGIVSVSVDQEITTLKRFVQKKGYTWTILLDAEGKMLVNDLGVKMLPTYYILDKSRCIVSMSKHGFNVADELKKVIR